MAVTFIVRGTQTDAWYSNSGKTHGDFLSSGGTAAAVTNVAGAFGGQAIDMWDATPRSRSLCWPGQKNWTQNLAFAVLIRIIPQFTGFPPDNENLLAISDQRGNQNAGISIRWNSAGTLNIVANANQAQSLIAATTTSTISGVNGTAMDIMVSWDGVTKANGVQVGVDGVLLQQLTAAQNYAAFNPTRSWQLTNSISCGFGGVSPSGFSKWYLNEIVLFDNAQTVVYTARTGYWPLSAFDALAATDPGIANVRSATAYQIAGVSLTGTAAIPVANNVRSGVATDATTGNIVIPTAAQVEHGIAFESSGGQTGTYRGADLWSDPGVANVANGVAYNANGVAVTGTVVAPTIAQVKQGVAFGPSSSLVGTYDGSNLWSDPGYTNVATGVNYLAAGVLTTGVLDEPNPADVREGVIYDNNTKVGTLLSTDPGVGNVADGVAYVINNSNLIGTLKAVTNIMKNAVLIAQGTDVISQNTITISNGDIATFDLTATLGDGLPYDLTGGVLTTFIRGINGTVVEIPNAQHTIDPDQINNTGNFLIAINAYDSELFADGTDREIITKVVQASTTTFFHGQNILTVLPNVPVQ